MKPDLPNALGESCMALRILAAGKMSLFLRGKMDLGGATLRKRALSGAALAIFSVPMWYRSPPSIESVIAGKFDFANLYLGSFFHFKNQDDRVAGGNALVLRCDFGKLAPMLAEQFLQDNFGLLDACGIKLAFHGEADLALFEAIENVGLRNGMNIVVANAAYDRALFDFEDHGFVIRAIGRIFDA